MGDRVLFQVHSTEGGEYGPVVYGHWAGARAGQVCRRLAARMKGREGDVQYTSARLVQELTMEQSGNLGFGLWNAEHILTAEDSHGDAGVVLIETHARGLRFQCLGGYLIVGPMGFPVERAGESA